MQFCSSLRWGKGSANRNESPAAQSTSPPPAVAAPEAEPTKAVPAPAAPAPAAAAPAQASVVPKAGKAVEVKGKGKVKGILVGLALFSFSEKVWRDGSGKGALSLRLIL